MTIKTNIKAGLPCPTCNYYNHNETLAVRSNVQAGGIGLNHNEALAVRSGVKAGGGSWNHSESFRR